MRYETLWNLWFFWYFADHWDWIMTYIRRKNHWFDPARQRIDGCFLHDWNRDMIKKHGANWTPQNSHGCWLNHFNSNDCYLNHHRLVGRIVWNHWYVVVSWMNCWNLKQKQANLLFRFHGETNDLGHPHVGNRPGWHGFTQGRLAGRRGRRWTENWIFWREMCVVCCRKSCSFVWFWRNSCHSDLVWWCKICKICKKTKREWVMILTQSAKIDWQIWAWSFSQMLPHPGCN